MIGNDFDMYGVGWSVAYSVVSDVKLTNMPVGICVMRFPVKSLWSMKEQV